MIQKSTNTLTLGDKLDKRIPWRIRIFWARLCISDNLVLLFFSPPSLNSLALPFRGMDRKGTASGLRNDVPSSPSCLGLFSTEVLPPTSRKRKKPQNYIHTGFTPVHNLKFRCMWLCDLSGFVTPPRVFFHIYMIKKKYMFGCNQRLSWSKLRS